MTLTLLFNDIVILLSVGVVSSPITSSPRSHSSIKMLGKCSVICKKKEITCSKIMLTGECKAVYVSLV